MDTKLLNFMQFLHICQRCEFVILYITASEF